MQGASEGAGICTPQGNSEFKGATMKYVAPRTGTVITGSEAQQASGKSGVPLESFAASPAYVLIGEPGAGKTTAFKREAEAQGGAYVTVRTFLTFDDKPEWRGKTLFLDGLDEQRAGTVDGSTPLDRIRGKLDRLGRPSFRLSCRWAEWQGANDKESLDEVSPDGRVTVLRLDALDREKIKTILERNHGVEDSDAFIANAKERGVEGLLKNPQTLELLAEAVSQGEWPKSSRETFERACRMLARETNKEHRLANPRSSDTERLVEAAGRLCAVQVLTGIAGVTLTDRATPDGDYPALEEIAGEAGGHARSVLGTRLFVGVSERRFEPVHRQIAEFLAARHVARRIDDGLPVGRAAALITGFDGELLPTFWNFSSWLGVHSKPSRILLSRLNPSGMIYAEEEPTYSVDERRRILFGLRRELAWNPGCLRGHSRTPGIGKVVCPELEDTFREILSEDDRSPEHQPHVMMLLQVLADGEPLPGLSGLLEDILVDPTWLVGARCAALDALIAYIDKGCVDANCLVELAGKVGSGEIEDAQDEILGILLTALYPKTWSVAEIQKFLRRPKDEFAMGEYKKFWTSHVLRESAQEQMHQLLDLVAARFEAYRPFMTGAGSSRSRMGVMPLELLEKVLDEQERLRRPSDVVSVERLLNWLKVASELRLGAPEWLMSTIRFHLEWNRDKVKELFAYSVETCMRDQDPSRCAAMIDRWPFGARSYDHGPWCLGKALSASDDRVASFYLAEAVNCISEGKRSGGLTVDEVRARISGSPALLELLSDWTARAEDPTPQSGVEHGYPPGSDTEMQVAWQQLIAAQAQELRDGRGEARILHGIAEAYLGVNEGVEGANPFERLGNLVGSRTELVGVLREGLESTVDRTDLPDCRRVHRLLDSERVHFLVLPFLAGLDSRERAARLNVGELDEDRIDLAVTVLYCLDWECLGADLARGTALFRPQWFRTLLRDDPALVSVMLRRSVEEKQRTGQRPAVELRHLAHDEDHREVARLAALPLLERFPNRDTEHARRELCWVLKAALKNCEPSQVHDVVERRLARADLPASQKIHWLLAGYLVRPDFYREAISSHSAESEAVLRGVWEFVCEGRFQEGLVREFEADEFEVLIVLIASALGRHGLTEGGWWIVPDLLGEMATTPSREISEAIERLAAEPTLAPWRAHVADVRGSTGQETPRTRISAMRHRAGDQDARQSTARERRGSGGAATGCSRGPRKEDSRRQHIGLAPALETSMATIGLPNPNRRKPAETPCCRTSRTAWSVWASKPSARDRMPRTRGRTSARAAAVSMFPWRSSEAAMRMSGPPFVIS